MAVLVSTRDHMHLSGGAVLLDSASTVIAGATAVRCVAHMVDEPGRYGSDAFSAVAVIPRPDRLPVAGLAAVHDPPVVTLVHRLSWEVTVTIDLSSKSCPDPLLTGVDRLPPLSYDPPRLIFLSSRHRAPFSRARLLLAELEERHMYHLRYLYMYVIRYAPWTVVLTTWSRDQPTSLLGCSTLVLCTPDVNGVCFPPLITIWPVTTDLYGPDDTHVAETRFELVISGL